jgi:hypothetical protein
MNNKNNMAKKILLFGMIALAIGGILTFSVATLATDSSDVPTPRLSEHYATAKFCTSDDPGCDCPTDMDPSCI